MLERRFESRRVRHDVSHRDRLTVKGRNGEIEIAVDVDIQVDLALFHELHDCRPGEQLRDRPWPKHGRRRIYRLTRSYVCIPVAPLSQNLSILDDHDHGTGNIGLCQHIGQVAIEPCVDIHPG